MTLVGASNELPESEELDALYDRFLIRKSVGQVSAAGGGALGNGASCMFKRVGPAFGDRNVKALPPFPPGLTQLLDYYAGNDSASDGAPEAPRARAGAGGAPPAIDPSLRLGLQEIAGVRAEAVRRVRVPQHVIQMVADLRWGGRGPWQGSGAGGPVSRLSVLVWRVWEARRVGGAQLLLFLPAPQTPANPRHRSPPPPQHHTQPSQQPLTPRQPPTPNRPTPNPQPPPRTYLQEKIEPPVYVSDRRLVKAIALMQVRGSKAVGLGVCLPKPTLLGLGVCLPRPTHPLLFKPPKPRSTRHRAPKRWPPTATAPTPRLTPTPQRPLCPPQ